MSETQPLAGMVGPVAEGVEPAPRSAERETQMLRERVRQASVDRAALLSLLSHELRTPMTAIVGMTDLLLLGRVDNEQRECLSTVRDAADCLMAILNDVCDYARVDAGILDFEWIGFRLRNLVAEVAQRLDAHARPKQIDLLISIDADVPDLLVGDPKRIGQVLHHLIDSALRLTKSGRVAIELAQVTDAADEIGLRIDVLDNGTGIAEEDTERVLEPFLGEDNALKRRYPLGPVGLPLAAKLVAAMGGQLRIAQEPQGGTRFTTSLQLLKQGGARTDAEFSAPRDFAGVRALVVDASAARRKWIGDHLRRWHARSTETEGLDAACSELVRAESEGAGYGVLLIDADVSRDLESGEFWSRARVRRRPQVIWMSNEQQRLADSFLADATLARPLTNDALAAALATALECQNQELGVARNGDSHARSDSAAIARCEVKEAIDRLGGDIELYRDLVKCFLDDTSSLFPKIRAAIDSGDPDGVHRGGHSLKGLAGSCGAMGVSDAAGLVEQLGREKRLSEIEAAWNRLRHVFEATRTELAQYYDR